MLPTCEVPHKPYARVLDGGKGASGIAIFGRIRRWLVPPRARRPTPVSAGSSRSTSRPTGPPRCLAATETVARAADPRNRIAILVDGAIVSAPAARAPISSGAVVLTSGLTEADAESLAAGLSGSR